MFMDFCAKKRISALNEPVVQKFHFALATLFDRMEKLISVQEEAKQKKLCQNDMGELLIAVNKASSYVNIVQCACDEQRAFLEQSFNREFQQFIKEWNRKGATTEKESQDIERVQEAFEVLELEELASVDNVLRKAKRIRERLKFSFLDGDIVNSCEDDITKFSSANGDEHERDSSPNQADYTKAIKQSISLPVMSQTKTRIPNVSVSHKVLKERRIKSSEVVSRARIPPPRVLTMTRQPIITKSQLNSYKGLCAKSDLRAIPAIKSSSRTIPPNKGRGSLCNEISAKMKSSVLGNHAEKPSGGNKTSKTHLYMASKRSAKLPNISIREKPCQPTRKDFLNIVQGEGAVPHLKFVPSFWYPFLSTANATRLTANIRFSSAKELRQIYTLLHSIQETIFWLDLFNLLGKDVIPHLNNEQREGAVMRSYIQSIFHPKLRRKPMVVEPKS